MISLDFVHFINRSHTSKRAFVVCVISDTINSSPGDDTFCRYTLWSVDKEHSMINL